ncbi:hypothetical protein BD309DRAFT_955812 [Dichomitus squalens]|nr:hypothetical protein BD309DRAFT_955812 [Dichomitus squalens]
MSAAMQFLRMKVNEMTDNELFRATMDAYNVDFRMVPSCSKSRVSATPPKTLVVPWVSYPSKVDPYLNHSSLTPYHHHPKVWCKPPACPWPLGHCDSLVVEEHGFAGMQT